ncbi:hypothetical protein ACROYT_G001164 [Oculina patagonica]
MGSALVTSALWLVLTSCETGFFRCSTSAECLPVRFKCDGHEDCEDSSDELNCTKQQTCPLGEFWCGDWKCISRRKVCDGTRDCSNGQDENDCGMQGIFENFGNKKTKRFPVYKTVKGFDIYLRFTAEKCTGQLVEITSRDTNQYLRITLLEIGPIRLSYKTAIGKGQLDLAMPYKSGFCDGKRHLLTLSLFRGVVSYGVDRAAPKRFYVSRLGAPFSSPSNIVVGRGLEGCITGSTVVNRFNGTQEYAVGISSDCTVKKTTTLPPKQRLFTYSARKLAISTTSSSPKCEPLTLTACKGLGYNFTQVPNPLQHQTYHQAATELSTFLSKLQSQCSTHLIPFLCRLYLPPCSLPQSAPPPCRSLCESVQEDCALLSPSERWPGHLNCEQFPRANEKEKCFLGSTKVTSKRTTLIRGTSEQKDDLTETNTLKTATTSNQVHPTKPVEIGEEAKNDKTGDHTTANPEKEIKSREPTTAARKSESRPMTDKLASVMTGKAPVTGKEMSVHTRQRKVLATTKAPLFTKKNNIVRNKTGNGTDANSRWNISSPSPASSKNKGGSCGGVLVSPKGQLMSPGYPAGYPSNTTCRWVIALSSEYRAISFTFHRVYLEEDRNCVYDYIAVYDLLDNQVGQRYCGSITSPVMKDVKGNVAVVVFRSDSANSKKGFILSYDGRKCLTSSEVDN